MIYRDDMNVNRSRSATPMQQPRLDCSAGKHLPQAFGWIPANFARYRADGERIEIVWSKRGSLTVGMTCCSTGETNWKIEMDQETLMMWLRHHSAERKKMLPSRPLVQKSLIFPSEPFVVFARGLCVTLTEQDLWDYIVRLVLQYNKWQ